MSGSRRCLRLGAAVGAGVLLAAAGLVLDAPRGAVDWRAARVVVLESDDWGLCGFFPTLPPQPGLRSRLGGGYPPAYAFSTLEDSAAVSQLASLLVRHQGRDGLPPILQANMIMSSLWARSIGGDSAAAWSWSRADLPATPPSYARPGLEAAIDTALAWGVWRPEYHGAFHYDPARRLAAIAGAPADLRPLLQETPLFPGAATAWELGHWRDSPSLAAELDRSLGVFSARFGRRPASVCAPDYVWDARCERLWAARGMTVIQAKREQRDSRHPGGHPVTRAWKLLSRARDRWLHPERVYLDRNCRFEPAQSANGEATLAVCLDEIRRAWARGEPAIVETHRVNYVSLAPGAAATGRQLLDRLLTTLESDPGGPPLYLSDDEVGQLIRHGSSWTCRGRRLVLRNLTRATRGVPLPAGRSGAVRWTILPPGETWRCRATGACPTD